LAVAVRQRLRRTAPHPPPIVAPEATRPSTSGSSGFSVADPPVRFGSYHMEELDGMAPDWAQWVERWHTLRAVDLKTGRAWAIKENLRRLWNYQRRGSQVRVTARTSSMG
jgi:hypothetical protein